MNLLFRLLSGCAFLQSLSVHAIDLQYLDEKLRQSKKEFIKIHIQHALPVQEKLYELQWDRLWRMPITSEDSLFAINMFDKMFILEGNRVMMPFLNDTSGISEHLQEVAQIGEYTAVKFVTNILWKNTIYLLLCYSSNLCSLYTGMSEATLGFRQTIRFKGVPVDAKFFTQHRQLYLIVAIKADKFPVPSLIYRWSDTYMDVVEEVITSSVVSVTTFEHRRSTIIVFACHDAENPWIGSYVYEFKDDSIAKIQILSIARPASVHHYVHGDFNFVLMVNEQGRSNVLCWDGRELLDWSSLLEIEPHSLITTFHMDGNTFVIVAHKNVIELYKFYKASDWKKENIKYLEEDHRIVDMMVSLHETTMTVTLIAQQNDGKYWLEQWQVKVFSVPIENVVEDADATSECLSDLIKTLETRMPLVREAKASWKLLPTAAEEPVQFDELILQSGNVDSVDITVDEDVLPPHQIERALNDLDGNVNDLLREQKVTNASMTLVMNNRIVVDELHVEELEIDRVDVDYLNDVYVRSGMVIFSQGDQYFGHPLHVQNATVDELEVESLCGIPSEYWTLKTSETLPLDTVSNFVEYTNDCATLHSDLTVPKLNVTSLNGVHVDEFIDNLFMINRTQTVKGKLTYKKPLQIINLTTQTLNDVPAGKLMTKTTNQSFDNFYMKNLEIDKLYAETINGVPVEEAARKSRNSVIKGKVKLATLRVTENFLIDADDSQAMIPNESPLQIYVNVTILGDLYLKNLDVESTATLLVDDDDDPVDLSHIFDELWTKSGEQTITEEVTLRGGLTIDRLHAKYLNNLTEDDFLYTTMEEIPSDFANLRLENFHVDEFFCESDPAVGFFQVEPYSLTISKNVRLSSLQAMDVITSTFNGANIFDIMKETGTNVPVDFLDQFPAIRAGRVLVDNLELRFFNDREVVLDGRLRLDDNYQEAILTVPEFHVENLQLENLNGIEMKLLTRFMNLTYLDEITVDGDLAVKNLTIGRINEQGVESFLAQMKRKDIVLPERRIEKLIARNITLRSLHGQNFNDLITSVLSRSTEQIVRGHFSARDVVSENVTTDYINERNASQLMWVDEPLTIAGDVTFSNLYVDGDVITSTLNERNVREVYDSLLTVRAKDIDLLKVGGSMSWNASSTSPASISYLLRNAVTTDSDQVITGEVSFKEDVRARAVSCSFNEINAIRDIVSDAVTDDGERVEIAGKKIFEKDLEVDDLTVNGDLDIHEINGMDIREFNDSVVRRDREETIVGPLTFLKDVKIERLRVKNNAELNASVSAAVRSNAVLPENVFFEELVVMGDVRVKDHLDGIDFDKFMSQRITLSGNNEISCSMQFNGVVTVTGNANIRRINGVQPSEFVLNNMNEAQKIYGEKYFAEDLVVEGEVIAPQINDTNIIREYEDGVRNDNEYVDIFGDLIFKSDVSVRKMNTSGSVNGVNLRSAVDDLKRRTNETVRTLGERWQRIVQRVNSSARASKALRNIFFYLETEEDLVIPGSNISRVDVMYINKDMIKLDMKSEQPGGFCDLPDHCPCLSQSMVELSFEDTRVAWLLKHGENVKRFYDRESNLEISVMTTAVSSGTGCTLATPKREYTVISYLALGDTEEILGIAADDIQGYLKDAAIFKYKGDIYAILAMNYDKERATHRVNSLVYKVDVETRSATLIQEFPTYGAWSIQIFEIEQRELFLLIGCFREITESLLYRFEPTVRKFEQLRRFASSSRYVKDLTQGKDHFVLLDNPDTNAVNIYKYDAAHRNFYSYQSIFHESEVNGIECFYADDLGNSDAFVIVMTRDGRFYIYEYMFAEKFQLRSEHGVDGLRTMVPFYYRDNHYILAGTSKDNIIYRIVKQGPH